MTAAKTRQRMAVTTLVAQLALMAGIATAQPAATLAGRWDAVVIVNGVEVPFPFEIVGEGAALKGSFFNGERRITSTSVATEDGRISFRFEQYASTLRTTVDQGSLTGEYRRARGEPLPFRAVRASASAAPRSGDAPSIDGTWVVQAKSNKGEVAWRFIAVQKGSSG